MNINLYSHFFWKYKIFFSKQSFGIIYFFQYLQSHQQNLLLYPIHHIKILNAYHNPRYCQKRKNQNYKKRSTIEFYGPDIIDEGKILMQQKYNINHCDVNMPSYLREGIAVFFTPVTENGEQNAALSIKRRTVQQ